ncbi:tripartite motif-containing protein 59-like [Pecten maximus]|uniref:tripartite motif-containing protein 59-like n=1 Tax=Pecten maximus TaxID=6579 RepID=UPI001458BCCE|nr:tripartite motif-containing protein 59-like [Pecten maximus]
MECPKHTSERVFMVCKSCVKYPLVCGVCIEEGEHAGHKLQTLRNAAQSIREDLEQVEKDKCQVFDEIKSDLKGLAKIREDQKMEASRVGDEIIKRADVVKGEVDTVNKEVVEKHKTELDKNTAAIDNTEIALTQQVSRIKMFQKKVAQLQKTNDYVEVIMVARDVEIPVTSRIPKPDIQNLKFLPGTVNGGKLEQMFGTIRRDNATTAMKFVSIVEEEGDGKIKMSSGFVGSTRRKSNTVEPL